VSYKVKEYSLTGNKNKEPR